MSTVWETEDQRLILVHDECPLEPYDDGSSPVIEWNAYLDGDVYGAVLQRRETWTNSRGETRDEWETEDSVWGFYGAEWAEDGALEHFPNPASGEQVAS